MAENGNGNRTKTLLRVLLLAVLGFFGQRFVSELDERDARAESRADVQDRQVQIVLAQHAHMIAIQQDTLVRVERMEKILLERKR